MTDSKTYWVKGKELTPEQKIEVSKAYSIFEPELRKSEFEFDATGKCISVRLI